MDVPASNGFYHFHPFLLWRPRFMPRTIPRSWHLPLRVTFFVPHPGSRVFRQQSHIQDTIFSGKGKVMCSCTWNPFFICLPMTSGGGSWNYDVTVYQNWQTKMLTFQHSCDRISLLKLQHPREPLNKSSAAVSGSFPPTLQYRKRGIHKVFRRFRYLDWPKNLSLTALADLIRGSPEDRRQPCRKDLRHLPF